MICCNNCKTFFRRCVLLSKFFKCKYFNECDVGYKIPCKFGKKYSWVKLIHFICISFFLDTPCKGCRLAKCVTIGMNPEAIHFPQGSDASYSLEKFYDFQNNLQKQLAVNKISVSDIFFLALPFDSQTRRTQLRNRLPFIYRKQD